MSSVTSNDGDDVLVKGDDGTTDGQPIKSYGQSLATADILNGAAVYSALTVGTSAVELKVGGSALALRAAITMQADDNAVYWGYSNSVTTSTGTRLFKNQFMFLPLGVDRDVWLIADGAGKTVRISEIAVD